MTLNIRYKDLTPPLCYQMKTYINQRKKNQQINQRVWKILWILLVSFTPNNFAETITYCNKKDCIEIEQSIVDEALDRCHYKSIMSSILAEWKIQNRWKQVVQDKLSGKKTLNCLPRIPNMILTGDEKDWQLNFLNNQKCVIYNLKIDPIKTGDIIYNNCVRKFSESRINY